MKLASVPELIGELSAGRAIVLVDDEDRENEGDLIVAAELVTADMVNFMARYARGLICLTLTPQRCSQLGLRMQVKEGSNQFGTNFTVPIEAATGVTTGISAADRAHTIRTAVAADASPNDLVQPGHVFPVRAVPGGVLERAGHTEAGSDLCRLAGLEPASVLAEILNEDGSMARRPDLEVFSEQHGLKMGSIVDVIRHRSATESVVSLERSSQVETLAGSCELKVYTDSIAGDQHLAFVFGNPDAQRPVPVRVHQYNPLHDLASIAPSPGDWSFAEALRHIAKAGAGVLVLLGDRAGPSPVSGMSDTANGGQMSLDTRTVGIGSQILNDLGVHKVCVLDAPNRSPCLSGFGLEVVEFLSASPAH